MSVAVKAKQAKLVTAFEVLFYLAKAALIGKFFSNLFQMVIGVIRN